VNTSTEAARDDVYEGRALAAAFPSREAARDAARRLHDEGFRRTWMGVTSAASASGDAAGSGETRVTGDGETLGEKIERFFSGERGDRTLYDELTRHGVSASTARHVDAYLPPNSAILTVDGSNHPELAASIVEECGGHILAGESFGATTPDGTTMRDADDEALTGSEVLGYGDASRYARGEEISEDRRMQLREERLNIDKEQVPLGEAQIGKEVVEHRQDVDVPTIREELFVERRPVSEATRGDAGEITEGEVIRVPLMRERVVVTKRPIVTGEVVIGKRGITETQRVQDTTREERLKVNDPTGRVRNDDLGRTRSEHEDPTL
jgi:uncharacterized protein (TIGR02271 family)